MSSGSPWGLTPRVELPTWSPTTAQSWSRRGERATRITTRAGCGRNFEVLTAEVRDLLLRGDEQTVLNRLQDQRRFDRALLLVWLDDVPLAQRTTSALLLRGLADRSSLSRLTLALLVRLLLEHFDRLETWRPGLFAEVTGIIRQAARQPPPGRGAHGLAAFREHEQFLLRLDGPDRLADHLQVSSHDLTDWLHDQELTAHLDGRFGRAARDAFYLKLIQTADAEAEGHSFLTAVTTEVVALQRTEDERLHFGHQVLAALTDKPTRHPHASWLEAVIAIGGDPRMNHTQQWDRWWAKLPEANRRRAVRWMRGIDLRAFLDGVSEYARVTSNDAMTRMLERRRRLLLGLYEQDRVDDVRLILGRDVRLHIENSAATRLSEVATLTDSSRTGTAVIYLDCGDFCLIEGSHNFSIHVFAGSPLPRVSDRRQTRFVDAELREDIPNLHRGRLGPGSHLSAPHQGFDWVRKVLDFLRDNGISVDERALMTPSDYAELQRIRMAASHTQWR